MTNCDRFASVLPFPFSAPKHLLLRGTSDIPTLNLGFNHVTKSLVIPRKNPGYIQYSYKQQATLPTLKDDPKSNLNWGNPWFRLETFDFFSSRVEVSYATLVRSII